MGSCITETEKKAGGGGSADFRKGALRMERHTAIPVKRGRDRRQKVSRSDERETEPEPQNLQSEQENDMSSVVTSALRRAATQPKAPAFR